MGGGEGVNSAGDDTGILACGVSHRHDVIQGDPEILGDTLVFAATWNRSGMSPDGSPRARGGPSSGYTALPNRRGPLPARPRGRYPGERTPMRPVRLENVGSITPRILAAQRAVKAEPSRANGRTPDLFGYPHGSHRALCRAPGGLCGTVQ
jgi:hypothetical protein